MDRIDPFQVTETPWAPWWWRAEKDVADEGQWEAEEMGRGLANCNSVQIEKVKGLNVEQTEVCCPAVYVGPM